MVGKDSIKTKILKEIIINRTASKLKTAHLIMTIKKIKKATCRLGEKPLFVSKNVYPEHKKNLQCSTINLNNPVKNGLKI